jgi:hypothetical protein
MRIVDVVFASIIAAAAVFLTTSAASASIVTYEFYGTETPANPFDCCSYTGDLFELQVTQAAVDNGVLNFHLETSYNNATASYGCGFPLEAACHVTGNESGFYGISYGGWDPVKDATNDYLVDISILFDKNGTLTGGILLDGEFTDLSLGGTGYSWSGEFRSDAGPNDDYVSGYWLGPELSTVPEPSSFALLLAGLLTVGGVLHRVRKTARAS